MRLRNIPEAKGIIAESTHVIHVPQGEKISVPEMIAAGKPVHMEIGMGKGAFLIGMANAHPENFYIGVERYETVLLRAVQKMDALEAAEKADREQSAGDGAEMAKEKSGIEHFPRNVKFLCEDAANLQELFPAGSVERLYLNFSDPWPKARHEKRRLTSSWFLSIYEKFLIPGALLIFKTDNTGLFEFSVESLEAAEHWTVTDVTRDLHRTLKPGEENFMTEYEKKFSRLGSRIGRLTARFDG